MPSTTTAAGDESTDTNRNCERKCDRERGRGGLTTRLRSKYRTARSILSLGRTLTRAAVSILPRLWRERHAIREGVRLSRTSTRLFMASANCPSCAEYDGHELCHTHEAANRRVTVATINGDATQAYGLEAALATHPDEAGILVDPLDPDVDRSNLFLGGAMIMAHDAYDRDTDGFQAERDTDTETTR